LFTYTFIIIGTFAVVELIQGVGEARNDLGAVRGLSRREPLLAVAMLVLLLAQAGVPFTSGFLAKFYVISAVIQRGQYPLAVIAMLAAAVAAFFYLRVALLMYSPPDAEQAEGEPAVSSGTAVAGEGPATPAPVGAAAPVGVGPGGTGVGSASSLSPASGASGTPLMNGESEAPDDDTLTAGLEPVPGLDGPETAVGTGGTLASGAAAGGHLSTVTFEAPPRERIKVPLLVGLALTICVVFTIVAGVTTPVITFARQATTLF
jgi:NADH:ubiquinone oxidoreductase subunit 5 (subunit L)/multisubunit Na+/H+ antiporter MnhA subunit